MKKTTTADQIESLKITDDLVKIAIETLTDVKIAINTAVMDLNEIQVPIDPEVHIRHIDTMLRISATAIRNAIESSKLISIFAEQGKKNDV
jgi:hypothetical protein